jgi:hypothetical protein
MTEHRIHTEPEPTLLPFADIAQNYPGILAQHGIPIETWGQGTAKTLDDFYTELQAGESTLFLHGGELRRRVTVANIDVYHTDAQGKTYRLREERQVFSDGRVRSRDLPGSIGEKMLPGEDPTTAFVRALQEELGLTPATLEIEDSETTSRISNSYPGLMSDMVLHGATATVAAEDFVPEGYVEIQDNKTTYFVWDELPQLDL